MHIQVSWSKGALSGLLVLVLSTASSADVLTNLGASDVFSSYTYPGKEPGHLDINDDGVGAIATLVEGGILEFDSVEITMSLPFVEELDDPNDELAHGLFGAGTISIVDTSADGPGVSIFEALVEQFEFAEDVGNFGFFVGVGTFVDAVYGGALGDVDLPLEGDLVTDLFQWYADPELTTPVNIDNFDGKSDITIYGEMQINISPEPSALIFLAITSWMGFGRSRLRASLRRSA